VDTLLLSCRVLGRGVEHRIVAGLGEIAREHGLERVDLRFSPTPKNKPASDFLRSIAAEFNQGDVYCVPVEVALAVEKVSIADVVVTPEIKPSNSERVASTRVLARVALELCNVDSILRSI